MGIPRFYSCLCDRYPNIWQTLHANQLPEYDYFYIDLNILLHRAVTKHSHLPHEQPDDSYLDENRIFERVLRWIETLYRLIQPSRMFYLASDGVAPCAKWSTQRQRRTDDTRYDATDARFDARFDARCISPGTEFMANFEAVLIEFVTNKMKFDRLWQKCEIVVNGSSCAGEGSMKIVEFISTLKLSSEYFPLAKHCIYSADNDFLLLGIATRELNVTLIQEVRAARNTLTMLCAADTKHRFDVMHVEILREYLRLEFADCAERIAFEFDADRIADDWVLVCMLMGNDYIPKMPNFNCGGDILSLLCDTYREALYKLDGYLHRNGRLSLERFEVFMSILRTKDFDLSRKKHESRLDENANDMDAINDRMTELCVSKRAPVPIDFTFSDFLELKDQYYEDRFGDGAPSVVTMTGEYMRIINWSLAYFYGGASSWRQRYQYAWAPYASDLTACDQAQVWLFQDKQPKPFDHLLAILPANCMHLLPKCYASLAQEDGDMQWLFDAEAVENRTCHLADSLTEAERARNTWNVPSRYTFLRGKKVAECVNVSIHSNRNMDLVTTDEKVFRPNKNRLDSALTSFPLLEYTARMADTDGSAKLWLDLNNYVDGELEAIATEYVNKVVNIGWPFSTEAKIVAVMNAKETYRAPNNQLVSMPTEYFDTKVESLTEMYQKRGINVGEIRVVAIARPVVAYEYRARLDEHIYDLVHHSGYDQPVALQTIVKQTKKYIVPMAKFLNQELKLYGPNVFMHGEQSRYFGEMVSVAETKDLAATNRINILGHVEAEPDFTIVKANHDKIRANSIKDYKQASSAAALLSISSSIFSFITGNVTVTVDGSPSRKVNVGLNFKARQYERRYVKEEYVKSVGKMFLYSQKAIDLVEEYLRRFPRLFIILSKMDAIGRITTRNFEDNADLDGMMYLTQITDWLAQLPCFREKLKPANIIDVSPEVYDDIKRAVQETHIIEPRMIKLRVKWQNLYIPDMHSFFMNPCPDASFKLLDRVIVVRHGYAVNVGSKGTIVTIIPLAEAIDDTITDAHLWSIDILMDCPYRIKSDRTKFEWHQIYRTQSTNMLLNISNGRYQ